MSASLRSLVEKHIVGGGVAPGASAAVAIRTPGGWRFESAAAGVLSTHNVSEATTHTLYDLASITKSVTAVLTARLFRKQGLSLDEPLGGLLPRVQDTASSSARVWQLLSHRAGLEAHIALYEPLTRGRPLAGDAWLLQAAEGRRADCRGSPPEAGFPPLYSDLGFILVGATLEAITHVALDEVVDDCVDAGVLPPLRSSRSCFSRGKTLEDFAPTETVSWRGGELRGVVHDENAFAIAADGCAGHAGLFGTAGDVARFGATLLDSLQQNTPLIDTASLRLLLQRRGEGSLRAGFDGKSPVGSSAGERFGADAFGHLGFTGTSYWCDPASGTVVALLTNRVCPSRKNVRIRAVRPKMHTAMFDYAQTLTKAS